LENLEKLYKRLVMKNPKNIQYQISMAVTQKEMSKLNEARKTIEELLKNYPQLKDDANLKKFLESLP